MKVYTLREFSKILHKNGWQCIRQHGSHITYTKNKTKDIITLVNEKEVNPCMAKKMIRQHNLALEI